MSEGGLNRCFRWNLEILSHIVRCDMKYEMTSSHTAHYAPPTPHTTHLPHRTLHTSHTTHYTPPTPHTTHHTLHTTHYTPPTPHTTHLPHHTPHLPHHTLHHCQLDTYKRDFQMEREDKERAQTTVRTLRQEKEMKGRVGVRGGEGEGVEEESVLEEFLQRG